MNYSEYRVPRNKNLKKFILIENINEINLFIFLLIIKHLFIQQIQYYYHHHFYLIILQKSLSHQQLN